jgi:small-conductance mechanosensitive channel
MLGIGLLARTIVVSQTDTYSSGSASVSYPAGWTALQKGGENELLNVGEPFDSGLFPARFVLLQMPATSVSTSAQSLGDFALKFLVSYYVKVADYGVYLDIQQSINFAIKDAFECEGIEMAYPTSTVYVKKEALPKIVKKETVPPFAE